MCVCVCALSGRPANTLSRGGSLIYKALNEGQQRRGARTSLQLIVCLFTFTFRFHPPHRPPSTHVTQKEEEDPGWYSSTPRVKEFQLNKSKLSYSKFSA